MEVTGGENVNTCGLENCLKTVRKENAVLKAKLELTNKQIQEIQSNLSEITGWKETTRVIETRSPSGEPFMKRQPEQLRTASDISSDVPLNSEETGTAPSGRLNCSHPLLIDIIVKNIAKYNCSYETLENARLVCSKWNEAFSPQYQSKARLHANFDITGNCVSDFVVTFQPSAHENRRITALSIHSPKFLENTMFRTWMGEYGQFLKHVKIGCEDFIRDNFEDVYTHHETGVDIQSLQLLLLKWCPNLEELIVPHPYLTTENVDEQIAYIETIERSVSLKFLQFGMNTAWGLDYRMENGVAEFMKETFSRLADVDILKLQDSIGSCELQRFIDLVEHDTFNHAVSVLGRIVELDLRNYRTSTSVIETLGETCSFSGLKSLKFGPFAVLTGIYEDGVENPNIAWLMMRLLMHLRLQLEELDLQKPEDECITDIMYLEFPIMPNLKIFKNTAANKWRLPDLNFIFNCPNLQVLDVRGCKQRTVLPYFMITRQIQQLSLHTLHLTYKFECRRDLRDIVEMFPNLKSLSIVFTGPKLSDALRILSRHNRLQNLSISGTKKFTGFADVMSSFLPQFQELTNLSYSNISQISLPLISAINLIKMFLTAPKLISVDLCGFQVSALTCNKLYKIWAERRLSPRQISIRMY